jgi:hypothetical protein
MPVAAISVAGMLSMSVRLGMVWAGKKAFKKMQNAVILLRRVEAGQIGFGDCRDASEGTKRARIQSLTLEYANVS